MFCSLPHSHLLVSDRPQACSVCRHLPWPTRNLLRVFQIGHGWLLPLARHSTGMIPLASQELAPAPKAFHLSSQRVFYIGFLGCAYGLCGIHNAFSGPKMLYWLLMGKAVI